MPACDLGGGGTGVSKTGMVSASTNVTNQCEHRGMKATRAQGDLRAKKEIWTSEIEVCLLSQEVTFK